mgnify:CR=1 FL=1
MIADKKIGLFVLTLFIVGSIDSLRNMPSNAMFGAPLIFFFIVASITFLLPIALISAELTSYHPEKNGASSVAAMNTCTFFAAKEKAILSSPYVASQSCSCVIS